MEQDYCHLFVNTNVITIQQQNNYCRSLKMLY